MAAYLHGVGAGEGRSTSQGTISTGSPAVTHLDSLQALRALAATTVIFDHIAFMRWGAFGVDIFFVLSGFVICYISAIDPSHFFPKRVFRVVPLYWLCTFGVAAIALAAPSLLVTTSFSPLKLLKSLFFIPFHRQDHMVAPLLFLGWTLEMEMLFYAIFGICLKITRKYVKELAIAAIILLALVGKIARVYHHSNVILNFYSLFVILEFAMGIACYMLWTRYGAIIRRMPWLLAIAAAGMSYAFFVLMDIHALDSYGPGFRYVPDFLLRGIPASLILLAFLSVEERFRFPAILLLVGDASYSLYLLHPYILQALDRKVFALNHLSVFTALVAAGSIAVCYGCAVLSFKLFEYPSNQFLRRYFLKSRRASPIAEQMQAATAP